MRPNPALHGRDIFYLLPPEMIRDSDITCALKHQMTSFILKNIWELAIELRESFDEDLQPVRDLLPYLEYPSLGGGSKDGNDVVRHSLVLEGLLAMCSVDLATQYIPFPSCTRPNHSPLCAY